MFSTACSSAENKRERWTCKCRGEEQETDIFTSTSTKVDWACATRLIPVVWTSDSLMFTETMQCCRGKRYANIVANVRAESFKARSRGMMNSCRGIRTQQFLEYVERVWMWFVAQFTSNRLDDRLECKQAWVTLENVRFCRPSRVDDYI